MDTERIERNAMKALHNHNFPAREVSANFEDDDYLLRIRFSANELFDLGSGHLQVALKKAGIRTEIDHFHVMTDPVGMTINVTAIIKEANV